MLKGKSSLGSRIGASIGGGTLGTATKGQRQEITKAQAAINSYRSGNDIKNNLAASPEILKQDYIGRNITVSQAEDVISDTSGRVSHSQKKALLNNPEVIRRLMKENSPVLQTVNTLTTNLNTRLQTNLPTDPRVAGSVAAAQANVTQNNLNKNLNDDSKKQNDDNKELIRALNETIGKLNNP